MVVEQPDQMWPDRRICRDLERELAAVRLGHEDDARRIYPHFRRPRIKFANRSDRVGRANLESVGKEMVECRRGGEAQRTKLKAQNTSQAKASEVLTPFRPRELEHGSLF